MTTTCRLSPALTVGLALLVPSLVESAEKDETGKTSAFTTENFAGEWRLPEGASGGLPRLQVMSHNPGHWTVQAWGRCHPTDCDRGRRRVRLFNRSVGESQQVAAIAEWDHGHADTMMTLTLRDDRLQVSTYTRFKDDSGRLPYYMSCEMVRPNHRPLTGR